MTSSVADALVGRVIDGRYRILSHLADGGMASVYVALDGRLDREVALKIMRPGLATDDVFVERFRAEARSAARLSHPNVVAVFDQGEDDGEVFLAMELVEGKTLRDVIHEEAPLTAREALAILEPILLALRAAHAAGMIHRDVKPENVIVRRDGEVKVADFGLARAITNQATTSQTGVLLGTVSYLSPEQVERGVADTRSDVYAAGLLLFEMLTGRKAVTGGTPIQIAYNHVHGVDRRAVARVVPDVPAELDDLVARATAVEPDDRFESAAAFVAALREVRRGLSAAELDHRGAAVAPDPDSTSVLAPTSATTQLPPPTGRPAPTGRARPERHRTRPNELGRSALAGLPVHDDGPLLEHTAAMPIDRRPARRPTALAALARGGPRRRRVPRSAAGGSRPARAARPSCRRSSASRSRRPKARCEQASLSVETTEEFSEVKAKGVVLRVEPSAGSELGKQSTVRLVVSKGQERYAVPNLVGAQGSTTSGSALSPLTLRLGEQSQAWSETVPTGVVISQDPAPSESVKRSHRRVRRRLQGTRADRGAHRHRRTAFDAASAAITRAGLTVQRGQDVNSDAVPAGQVVSQSPDERHAAPGRRREGRRVQGAGHGAGAQRRRPARPETRRRR